MKYRIERSGRENPVKVGYGDLVEAPRNHFTNEALDFEFFRVFKLPEQPRDVCGNDATNLNDCIGSVCEADCFIEKCVRNRPSWSVADPVEFLLGPKAKSITGTVLTVDAGSTA